MASLFTAQSKQSQPLSRLQQQAVNGSVGSVGASPRMLIKRPTVFYNDMSKTGNTPSSCNGSTRVR
jgi:hypothetical protein